VVSIEIKPTDVSFKITSKTTVTWDNYTKDYGLLMAAIKMEVLLWKITAHIPFSNKKFQISTTYSDGIC